MKSIFEAFPHLKHLVFFRHGRQSEKIDLTTKRQNEGLSELGKYENNLMFEQFIDFLTTCNRGGTLINTHTLRSPVKRCIEGSDSLNEHLLKTFGRFKHIVEDCSYLDVSLYETACKDGDKKVQWLRNVTQAVLSTKISPETTVLIIMAHGPHCKSLPRMILGDNPRPNLKRLLHKEWSVQTSEFLVLRLHDDDLTPYTVPHC